MEQARLKNIISTAMQDFDAASLSVCLWDGEKTLSAQEGFSDIERGIYAAGDTLYSIGSSTKAFVATAICILADEGKLSLDAPIKAYLPWFKMSDPYMTEHLTARDALCHRSGMPRHDMMLDMNPDLTPREMTERLAWLPSVFPPRYRFQYQNHMYVLATVLVEELSGMSWGDFVRQRILNPLEMNNTYIYGDEIDDCDLRKSIPYDGQAHRFTRVMRQDLRQAAGAGSIYSSAEDMLRWLCFRLKGDNSILSDALRIDAQSPQMLIRSGEVMDSKIPGVTSSAYGMGWFVYSYRGKVVVHHGGAMNGYRSMQIFVPEANIAVSALTNSNAGDAVNAVAYTLIDEMLGLPAYDWNPYWKELYAATRPSQAIQPQESGVLLTCAADYAGYYTDPGYGTLQFIVEDNQLCLLHNGKSLPMRYRGGDAFGMLFDEISPVFSAVFKRNANGEVVGVEIPLEPLLPQTPVCFSRRKDT